MSPTPRHPYHPRSAAPCPRAAFTLIELLTVIAIIGILAAIIIPTVGKVRQSAQAAKCVSNLRQIGTAFQLYAGENRGYFPAPRQADTANPSANQNPKLGPWQLEIATYASPKLRADNMYRLKEVAAEHNAILCPAYLAHYTSQTELRDNGLNALGYGMNFELNVNGQTLNTNARRVTRFLATGIRNPSRQILVGDSGDYHIFLNNGEFSPLAHPSYPDGYSSGAPKRHGANAKYLFADGHVETHGLDAARMLLRFQP